MDENPLRALILIALELIRRFEEQTGITLPEGAMTWPLHAEGDPFPTAADGACLYPSRELGGTAGLYRWLAEQRLGEVVFANDLSWTVHGVDAVLRDRRTGRYILCEAKGTERPIANSPLRYLRRTRTKGRQLSWMWCWRSLADGALWPDNHGENGDNQDENGMPPSCRRSGVARPEARRRHRRLSVRERRCWRKR